MSILDRITIGQLLQYMERIEEPIDMIQIVSGGNDWENADELMVNSELIQPFLGRRIAHMSCEKSYRGNTCVIRIAMEQM